MTKKDLSFGILDAMRALRSALCRINRGGDYREYGCIDETDEIW
jgi:hypothetical protein